MTALVSELSASVPVAPVLPRFSITPSVTAETKEERLSELTLSMRPSAATAFCATVLVSVRVSLSLRVMRLAERELLLRKLPMP